jgi:hypothetical protein
MVMRARLYKTIIFLSAILLVNGCSPDIGGETQKAGRKPAIGPDYTDITIPPNIAPMNFKILEEGKYFIVTANSPSGKNNLKIRSRDGIIRFPEKSWKKLLGNSKGDQITFTVYSTVNGSRVPVQYDQFFMSVAKEPVDPYLAYRLLYPGYYSWSNIKIVQRCLENFNESSLIENQLIEKNCINCHSFSSRRSDRFMIHMRGSLGGTYFIDGKTISRVDPKIDGMPGGATYPSWHPAGRFIAFSSNQVRQSFYSVPEKTIEVFDLVSSIVLYDTKENETFMLHEKDTVKYLSTFPSWSPDGKYLYYCRAEQHISASDPTLEQIMSTHYNIVRKAFFEETRTFGETEMVYDASSLNKSASFPRISPDGRFLVFTLHDYGTFPIWHREADLWIIDLKNGQSRRMDINSDRTESYHTWSSNGRWLVFSSKRLDGRSARPFFTYIDSLGNQKKEFVLPQKDPDLYNRMLESFNIPEFVDGRIEFGPKDFEKAAKGKLLKANPGDKSAPPEKQQTYELKINERPIH